MAAALTFFEYQQLARRNTRVMVVLFLLAVVATVMAVNLVFGVIWMAVFEGMPGGGFLWGSLITAGVIFAVSAFHVAKLAGGGESVARMMGARPVNSDTKDALERRLLNVVEEMAIASEPVKNYKNIRTTWSTVRALVR